MKLIPLTQGKFAMVDDADFEWLNQWKWHYAKSRNTGYASRAGEHRGKVITMHCVILKPDSGLLVDHKDGDGTNNQRYNLRQATKQQNLQNSRKQSNNRSGYKGISFSKIKGRLVSRIMVDGSRIFLGYYNTAKEAHDAYCKAATKHHGDFANFGT